MITASEARKETLQNNVTKYEKIFNEIEEKINVAIENGEYVVNFQSKLPDFVEKKLRELGYEVEYVCCGYNEYEERISWKEAEIVEEEDKDPCPCVSCDPSFRQVCCGCDKEREWSDRHPEI